MGRLEKFGVSVLLGISIGTYGGCGYHFLIDPGSPMNQCIRSGISLGCLSVPSAYLLYTFRKEIREIFNRAYRFRGRG